MKTCRDCGVRQSIDNFYHNNGPKKLPTSYCKPCYTIRTNRNRASRKLRDPIGYKTEWMKQRYGITHNDYMDMVIAQDELCLICETPSKLVIDHDKQTGIIRGLLCSLCNVGIGNFDHNPAWTERATKYLLRFQIKHQL